MFTCLKTMLSSEQYTRAVMTAIQTNICILSLDLPPASCPTAVHPQITSLIYWDRKHFTRTPSSPLSNWNWVCQIPAGASQHIPVKTASLLSSWTTTPETHPEVKHSVSIRQLLFTRIEYICVKQTVPDVDELRHICFCEYNWFQ